MLCLPKTASRSHKPTALPSYSEDIEVIPQTDSTAQPGTVQKYQAHRPTAKKKKVTPTKKTTAPPVEDDNAVYVYRCDVGIQTDNINEDDQAGRPDETNVDLISLELQMCVNTIKAEDFSEDYEAPWS